MAAVQSPNQTVQSEHISAPLTDFSLGYHPTGFVADQVFPVVPVKHRNDIYYKWDKPSAFRLERSDGYGTVRADGARASEENFGASTDGYKAVEFAKEVSITDEERSNADIPLSLEQSRVRRAQDKILLDYELRIANTVTTSANYGGNNVVTNSGVTQWNNASFASIGTTGSGHSLIEAQLLIAINAIRQSTGGLVPNYMVVPFAVAMVMRNDPGLIDLRKYTDNILTGSITPELVNALIPPVYLGMKILVPRAIYTTTAEGEAMPAPPTDVWGKNVVLYYCSETPALDSLSFGYTFRSRPWQVKTFRDEFTDKTIYRPSFVQAEKLVTADCGYLIKNAIA